MKTINILFTITVLIVLTGCKMISRPDTEVTNIQKLENQIKTLIAQKIPPSISVVVIKNKQVVYSKSFGHINHQQTHKATPNTIYQWWSITKLFTATAILQLHEQGLINLDDPVKNHLSFFNVNYKKDTTAMVTIRQLLSHSSGLGDIGMDIIGWIHYENDSPFNQTELVRKHLPNFSNLKANPGKEGNYSNLGYMVLAAVIEKVSNKPYHIYIKENILEPLEMQSTGFDYKNIDNEYISAGSHPKDFMSKLAFTMIDKDRAISHLQNDIYWFNNIFSNQHGSTGLIGSTNDLSHFMIAMMNEGVWKESRILSAESVKYMQKAHIDVHHSPVPGLVEPQFGLSWFIHRDMDKLALSHGGAGAAFVAQMRIYPEDDLGIAVMANSTYLEKDMGSSIISDLARLNWD